MRAMKKWLAALLALAMILTGLYIVPGEADEAKATASNTETVSEEGATVEPGMLTVKVQPGTGTDAAGQTVNALRFITSVNSLEYKAVGFVIDWEGNTGDPITYAVKDNTVFERIESIAGESYMSYKYGPKVVDTSAEYFATGKLNVTGKESVLYTVTAYVVTFDDETVYGTSRCVSYDDAISTTYTNVSFVSDTDYDTSETEQETIEGVTSSASATGTYKATVIGSDKNANGDATYNIHVRVPINPNTLPSATVFTFGTDETAIYRNLYTTHTQAPDATETSTTAYADTSWYNAYKTVNSSETEFVIATTADLYGFSELVTAGTFGSATAYLCADLTVNTNTPTTDPQLAASWDNYTPQYSWTPIGTYNEQFAGIFDGVGHSISGLYTSLTANWAALFAATTKDSVVCDLKVKDSYFATTTTQAGSISGRGGGNFYDIYSNAVAVTGAAYCAGIIGLVDQNATIEGCWFAGEAQGHSYVAGMIGQLGLESSAPEVALKNCLVSGKITSTRTDEKNNNSGGLFGMATVDGTVINASNCMVMGTSESANGDVGIGAFGGRVQNTAVLNLKNCYAISENYPNKHVGSVETSSVNWGVNAGNGRKSADTFTGDSAYANTNLDFWINEADENKDNVWVARTDTWPILKKFEDESNVTRMALTPYIKADTRWHTEATTVDGNAAGTEANPYILKDADDFYGFASLLNSGTTFKDLFVVMSQNITFNTVVPDKAEQLASWTDYTPEFSMISIGKTADAPDDWSSVTKFAGTFDGKNYTISGVYIAETEQRWTGLFAAMSSTGCIQNLTLEKSYIEGNSQIGSIVARGYGSLINVHSSAVVNAVKSTSYSGATAGGLVGQAYDATFNMSSCEYSGEISAAGGSVSGICGFVNGEDGGSTVTIQNSSFTGKVSSTASHAAGVVAQVGGNSELDLIGCTSSGVVTNTKAYVGGLISNVNGDSDVEITSCLSDGTYTSTAATSHSTGVYVGGMIASVAASSTVNVEKSSFVGTIAGGTTYPGSRMAGVISYVNTSDITISETFVGGTITSSQQCGSMIGAVEGSVSGTTALGSTISLTDCHFDGTINTTNTGYQNAGGLVGFLAGTKAVTVDNVKTTYHPELSVTATRCLVTGYLNFAKGTGSRGCKVVGRTDGNNATFNGAGGVYVIDDTTHIPAIIIEYLEVQNGTGGWAGTEAEGVSSISTTNLTGANAVDNLPTLGIETTSTSTSTWVAIKDGFPTLRIFANADDIYTTE